MIGHQRGFQDDEVQDRRPNALGTPSIGRDLSSDGLLRLLFAGLIAATAVCVVAIAPAVWDVVMIDLAPQDAANLFDAK